MAKRINVILPDRLVNTLDRLVKPGERSRFIDRAIQHYVATRSAEGVAEELRKAALRDRDLDTEISDEWNAVDHDSWQRLDHVSRRRLGRAAGRSTSRHSTRR
jgi:CopG family transcriptional regulator / antitoxin EndoAI